MTRCLIFIFCIFYTSRLLGLTDIELSRKYSEIGVSYFKKGEYQKAIGEFKKAFRLSKLPARLQNIARCYELLKISDKALEYYMEYLIASPDKLSKTQSSLTTLFRSYMEGEALLELPQISRWADNLKKIEGLKKAPVLHAILAVSYFKQAQLSKAGAHLKTGHPFLKEHRLEKALAQFLYRSGQFHFQAKQYALALSFFEFSFGLNPSQGDKIAENYIQAARNCPKLLDYSQTLQFYRTARPFVRSPLLKELLEKDIQQVVQKMKQKPIAPKDKHIPTPPGKMPRMEVAGWSILGVAALNLGLAVIFSGFTIDASISGDKNYDSYKNSTNPADIKTARDAFNADKTRYNLCLPGAIATGVIGVVLAGIGTTLVLVSRLKRNFQKKQSGFRIFPVGGGKNQAQGAVLEWAW